MEKNLQKIRQTNEQIEAQNRQLRKQSEELIALDKARTRFFTNISHEFRTPLTLIKCPLEQILAENPGTLLETRANMMMRSTRSLLNLVEQLLELARFDSGKMKLQVTRQDIVSFVKNLLSAFEPLALQNKVELIFPVEAEEIFIYFDPEKLERIITNLLSNAFNYTPHGGKITVSIRRAVESTHPSGCVEIVVSDTGAGIPADQVPYIFDRFYQGENSHEYMHKGTGIGLALTKELMELHHGEIEVHSSCQADHTRGTKFILRLPMGKTHPEAEEIAPETEHRIDIKTIDVRAAGCDGIPSIREDENEKTFSRGGPGKDEPGKRDKPVILVVEDNADLRTYIKGALESQFNVEEAANGQEGMDKSRELIPDLVISDVMMPGVDGFEFCTRLKQDIKTGHIPVIFLTARASGGSVTEGFNTGAEGYIVKPIDTEILVIRVRNLIRSRRQLLQKLQRDMLLPGEISVLSTEKKFLKELETVLKKHITDPEFNVEHLAGKLNIGETSLRRKVLALTGETPNSLIRSYRLTRAAQLLKANFGNVTEVAFAVGFSDASYFAKCFKEKFHESPRRYKG